MREDIMKSNPWNIKMDMEFDQEHKKELVDFYNSKRINPDSKVPKESKEYLVKKYDEGYGLKVIARALGISYTMNRTLFKYLSIEHRKGRNVVTPKTKEFRSYRVRGCRNPWVDWTNKYQEMGKSNDKKGLQGYYKRSDGKFVYLRSSWEYVFAKWLDKNNIKWEYEYKQYVLENGEKYRPDFFIFNDDGVLTKIIEIKGYNISSLHKTDMLSNELKDVTVILIRDVRMYSNLSEREERKEWSRVRLLNVE